MYGKIDWLMHISDKNLHQSINLFLNPRGCCWVDAAGTQGSLYKTCLLYSVKNRGYRTILVIELGPAPTAVREHSDTFSKIKGTDRNSSARLNYYHEKGSFSIPQLKSKTANFDIHV